MRHGGSLIQVAGAGGPGQVYIDTRVPVGRFRDKPLRIDGETLVWGDEAIDFDDVTALAYWRQKVVAKGVFLGFGYNIDLYTGKKRTRVSFGVLGFGGVKEDVSPSVFEQAVAALRRHVEWRLLSEVLARVDDGEEVEVGFFLFSRRGISRKRRFSGPKRAPWSAALEIRPFSSPEPGGVKIFASDRQGETRKIGDTFVDYPNVVLLPPLIRACVDRYSSSAVR
jgi:hypothetical protein